MVAGSAGSPVRLCFGVGQLSAKRTWVKGSGQVVLTVPRGEFSIHPAAFAGEIGEVGSLPGVAGFSYLEDSAAAAIAATFFDYRHQGSGVGAIEAGITEIADVAELLAGGTALAVAVHADQGLRDLVVVEKAVRPRNGEFAAPVMALPVGGFES